MKREKQADGHNSSNQQENHKVITPSETSTAEATKVIKADPNNEDETQGNDTTVQKLQFELMRNSSHLRCYVNVERVISDLKAWPALWLSCYTFNSHWGMHEMNGIHENDFYSDSICILSTGENDELLFEIAEQWGAEEMDWLDAETDAGYAEGDSGLLKLCFY